MIDTLCLKTKSIFNLTRHRIIFNLFRNALSKFVLAAK
jgi:hypothetical protein